MPFWSRKKKKKDSGTDRTIDAMMKKDREKDMKTIKVLLLGAGNSGKSTVYRQLTRLFKKPDTEKKSGDDTTSVDSDEKTSSESSTVDGDGLDDADRDQFKMVAVRNIIEAVSSISKSCLAEAAELGAQFNPEEGTVDLCKQFSEYDFRTEMTDEIASSIKKWWSDPAIHVCLQLRKHKTGMDNLDYLMKKLDDFTNPDYKMKFEDASMVRIRTTGVLETTLEFTPLKSSSSSSSDESSSPWRITLVDVGGQRSERKKWIHCFDDVNSVIYIMALSAYDYVLFEDNQQNCYDETLQLFADITSKTPFSSADFIVFLNKWDLFCEKIKTTAFNFQGKWPADKAHATEEVAKYVENMFREKFEQGTMQLKRQLGDSVSREVFFYRTCAVDNDGMAEILPKISQRAIDQHIKRSMVELL